MNYQAKSGVLAKQKTPCIVLGVYEGLTLTEPGHSLDKITQDNLIKFLQLGDFSGKLGHTHIAYHIPGLAAERVLLVGCGKAGSLTVKHYQNVLTATAKRLKLMGASTAINTLIDIEVAAKDRAWKVKQAILLHEAHLYQFDQLKSEKSSDKITLNNMVFLVSNRNDVKPIQTIIHQSQAIANGAALARDLGNLPGNVCTPSYLAKQAQSLAKASTKVKTTSLNETQMLKLGMGAFCSVAKGSNEPAKLICIEYMGASKKNQRPIVFVGKGVTFDSGGISLKPGANMDEMKFDMCGAASVFGAMKAIIELELPLNVIGLIGATENMPSGTASKPGDIVTSMSGQTIEILNTDAEGRLVLCDVLTYAQKYKPEVVIDVATLTGACVIALGNHPSGLYSNDEDLGQSLFAASEDIHDRVWPMPLWEDYQDQLKSNFADMANIGGAPAGSVTAACFLSRFTKDVRWAHLDIAGTAWLSGAQKGATGRPVPLLTQFAINQCQ